MRWSLLPLLLLSAHACSPQVQVNPNTQIQWPRASGVGAPISTCNGLNYGAPYSDRSTGAFYVCVVSGWQQVVGATSPAVSTINGTSGAFTFTGSGASCTGNTCNFPATPAGVSAINGTAGGFTFTGPGVGCTGLTCTFSGTGAGVTTFNGNSGAFAFTLSNWLNFNSGSNTYSVKTQRGNDAVVDWGFDSSGAVNATNTTAMGTYLAILNTIGAPGLKIPCGNYYFSSTVHITQKYVNLVGDNNASNGKTTGCVTFQTDAAGPILWLDGSSNALAGLGMSHIQFYDSSTNHDQLKAAVRITDEEHNLVNDVSGWDIIGSAYNSTTDTIAVTNNSTAIVGTGTSFDTDCGAVAVSGSTTRYPCFFFVKDTGTTTTWPYEVSSCADATHCTLAIPYVGSTQATAGYSIHKGGVLFWHDPGPSIGQANQYSNYFVINTQSVWMTHYLASTNSGGTVNSRINFWGGWNNMHSVSQDAIFAYCGHFCDTMNFIGIAANGYPFGIVIAEGHQNTVAFSRFENNSNPPSVPTYGVCTAGGFPCVKGVVVMSANASDTYGNQIIGNYFRQEGNAIEPAGVTGQTPTQMRIMSNTFRTNTNNCLNVFTVATNTYGECDGVAAFKSLQINSGVNVMYRCSGGTQDGQLAWKTSVCTGGGGAALATSITTD